MAAKDDAKLADFLCFAVYSANLAFGRAYKPVLDELGLTYTQYIALVALWEQDGQTVGSLGEKLFLESNTLTPILKKLEAMGLLRRRRDAADERQVVVTLTPEGRAMCEKIHARKKQKMPGTGLSDDEFRKVQTAIAGVRDTLLTAMRAAEKE